MGYLSLLLFPGADGSERVDDRSARRADIENGSNDVRRRLYDYLTAAGILVKVAHSAMLKAIVAGKWENDTVDARKVVDLLCCDYFPECHVMSWELCDRRRPMRYRKLVVRQTVQIRNRMSLLLMEAGLQHKKKRR